MPLKLIGEIIVVGIAAIFAMRRRVPGAQLLCRFQRVAGHLARRKLLACVSMGLLVLLVRAALLPVWPVPRPSIYDEFSYLLQADTFAHGRATNPPHPLWQFFESVYILQQPTYASKYPPGQGLAMAAGQALTGNPWFGVWFSCGALAAALVWALQGWVPPGWALLGGLISLQLCLFSYWMNSYWGGAVAGIGGALMVGAWIRIVRSKTERLANWLFGAGAVLLLLTRPYEGFLLAAPTAVALWMRTKGRRAQVWLPILAVVITGCAWTAFFDYRVTGNFLRMPYQEYFGQYETVPPLNILPVQHTKVYRHFDLEFLDAVWARETNRTARSWRLLPVRSGDLYQTASMLFGDPLWLLVLLCFVPAWMFARRIRLPALLAGILVAGAMFELIFYAHYASPFTAALLILLVQSLRYLRAGAARIFPGGRAASRLVVVSLCGSVIGLGLAAQARLIYRQQTPDRVQAINARKGQMEQGLLERNPGRHVIFVRYTGTQSPHEEWIYNRADIDSEAVIWAQDMGAENNKLVDYYPGRIFWLFQPDIDPGFLQPYKNP